MISNNKKKFDIFLSYNSFSKETVELLHQKLTEKLGARIWIDLEQVKNGDLHEQLTDGILNSYIFLCCITKNYCESANCVKEISYADSVKMPISPALGIWLSVYKKKPKIRYTDNAEYPAVRFSGYPAK